MKETVIEFIKNFQNKGTIKTFTNGCCYWFAFILASRFEDSSIWYNQKENHFATQVAGTLYDITGPIKMTSDWQNWSVYRLYEPDDAYRVYRDCILKLDTDDLDRN